VDDFSKGYEERLFTGKGIRSKLHQARFTWVRSVISKEVDFSLRVFELGCFNGMLIRHIEPKVNRYFGVDANWEGGLDQAMKDFAGNERVSFKEASEPEELSYLASSSFDFSVCLETIEHVPQKHVPGYLEQMARITSGKALISVPVEIGPVFLAKHLVKRLLGYSTDDYSIRDVINSTLCRTGRIERNQHKGFNYSDLLKTVEEYFVIERVVGLPRLGLPPIISFGVGVIARPKNNLEC